jgi:hypothetical protein
VTVPPRAIVERFAEVRNISGCKLATFTKVIPNPHFVQAAEERFCHGVAPAVAFAIHARFKMIGLAESSPSIAAILSALVRIDWYTSRMPDRISHQTGVQHHFSMNRRTGSPAKDLARKNIHDDSQVQPAV